MKNIIYLSTLISFFYASSLFGQATNKLDPTGSVGVGTVSPDPNYKLEVKHGGLGVSGGSEAFFELNSLYSATNAAKWRWAIGGGSTAFKLSTRNDDGSLKKSIYTITHPGNFLLNGASDNNGKADFAVGVGNGGVATLGLLADQLRVGHTDLNWGVRLTSDGLFQTYGKNMVIGALGNASASQYISFSTINSGSQAERMRISQNGNVGIGTTSPDALLEIKMKSSDPKAQLLRFNDGGYDFGSIMKLSATDGKGLVLKGASSGVSSAEPSLILAGYANDLVPDHDYDAAVSIRAYDIQNNGILKNMPTFRILNGHHTTQLLVNANGNVGIGTNTPDARLRIDDTHSLIRFETVDGQFRMRATRKGGYQKSDLLLSAQKDIILFPDGDGTAYSGGGSVGIGTVAPDPNHKLTVNGAILSEKVKVHGSVDVPDYVFESDYRLRSIEELKGFIDQHGHLPGIKSAKEITLAKGFYLEEMDMALLEKVEELTLYTIEQEGKIKKQEEMLEEYRQKIDSLIKRMEKLERDK